MSCKKCTTILSLPNDSVQLLVFASHEYMVEKINYHVSFKINRENSEFLIIYADLESFLSEITSKNVFTPLDLDNISLIPMESDKQISFGLFKKAKTLSYYLNLYHSNDLKWILDNESIIIYFQPILDAKNKTVVAYERLARGVKADETISCHQKKCLMQQ